MKLATKGTLDTRAMIPRVARTPKKFTMLAFIVSKFTLTVPAYARIISVTTTTPMVNAMPEALLTNCPAK